MNHFDYKDGILHAEDVSINAIAAAVGTPFYVYSSATLKRHYNVFNNAFDGLDRIVCFAVKANSNQAVLTLLAKEGAGADVVSEGELRRALAAGIDPMKIVFSGVGKTDSEITAALDAGILQLNVESEPEMERIAQLSQKLDKEARVAFRFNPDVDAGTHEKISTGRRQDKFGIPWERASEMFQKATALGLKAESIAMHIGSQITKLDPYEAAYTKAADMVRQLRGEGYDIKRLDLGGGLGIPYDGENPPHPDDYGNLVKKLFGGLDITLMFEPGRLIAGNAGMLVSTVTFVKEAGNRRFVILDAAMNDLSRPAMYGAHHGLRPVTEPAADAPTSPADIVGPVCESGDTFAKNRDLVDVAKDDLVAFDSAGAYGAVMASTYNTRQLVPEVLVNGDQFAVIRKRQDFEVLIGLDEVPAWLQD